jgi:hypothetical protein
MILISSNTKKHQSKVLYVKDVYKNGSVIVKHYHTTSITFNDFATHFEKYKNITGLTCNWRKEEATVFEVEELKIVDEPKSLPEILEFITQVRKMLTAILPKLIENEFVVSDILFQNIGRKNNKLIFIDESKFKEESNINKQLVHFAIGVWRTVESASYNNINIDTDYVKREIDLFERDLKKLKL